MFSKEELYIIFDVFADCEMETPEEERLQKKMALLKEQAKIGDEANQKITELQNQINDLYKAGEENE